MYRKEVYLDNAASMKPYDEAMDVLNETFRTYYGNPSSSHLRGQQAKRILEGCRLTIATALEVSPEEIYFTSGGTESNNAAITGACMTPEARGGSIIVTALEHPSVTKTVRSLKRLGRTVDYLEVVDGELDLNALTSALSPSTALITCMAVQNELGYIFPLESISELRNEIAPQALFHTDAVQAFGKIDFFPYKSGIDLASMSSHKIGGPKGIGALFVRQGVKIFSTALGGGQEMGLRSGTEAVHQIAAFAKAVEITMRDRKENETAVRGLYAYLESRLKSAYEHVKINSRPDGSPYILSFTLPGANNKRYLESLSEEGISIATASACESNHTTVPKGTWRKKHPLVLQLAGISEQAARSTFRISFSAQNTTSDIDAFVEAFQELTKTAREE